MPDGQVGRPAMDLVPRYKEEHVFIIEAFIVHSVRESGRKGVILGLSGGIDSALVAKLCADAIGPLYKTQVREMAVHLGVPPEIVEKTPTAGLWPGQTDEGELGIPYADLDRVLLGIELQMDPEAIAEKAGVPLERVRHVQALVGTSVHKRKMPL